ncbi:rCG63431 [Rattus norvegicus]|uniref:RCG63431 n=1 Tax=Rattus norvegicus TaxID=10116 RepID=A6HU92_RAT|nr:rCG63431 [Rattus norvegicus]
MHSRTEVWFPGTHFQTVYGSSAL